MTRRGWLAAVVAGFMVVLLATACSSEGEQDNTERDAEGNIEGGGDVGVFALQEGDCFRQPPTGNLEEVAGVPCTDAHDSEVFAIFDIEGDEDAPFPGDSEVSAEAQDQCLGDLFTEFVGVPSTESEIGGTSINPTQDTWEQLDDREVICVAQSGDGSDLTESVKDANR